ncbi:MAG: EamA family transporter [Proteobacteria bacterium]|nr:EamA family transporter [Pseudomonadota bacterium]
MTMEMTLPALLAVAGCGLCYAGADFTRKSASQHAGPAMLVAIIFTAVIPLYIALFFASGNHVFSRAYILPGSLNILSNVIANIFFVRAVFASPLSKTVPLLSITPVLTALIGFFFLEETLVFSQWGGIVLVVLGILWLYVPPEKIFGFAGVWKNFISEPGAKFMCVTALFWTLAPVFDRVALRHVDVPTHALIHFTVSSALLWLWIFLRGGFKKNPLPKKEGWKIIGIVAAFYACAMGLQMLSLKMVYVGIMESVKRVIGQISAIALGRIAFGEEITTPKILGVIAMCIGVPLILLS